MKVILLQDVAKIGRRFQVVEVPDGYAMNKLIPMRQAEPATPANLKLVETRAKKQANAVAHTEEAFYAAVATLKGKPVMVAVQANADGKLFEAIKPSRLVEAVLSEAGCKLEESWVHTTAPIKSLGEHTIMLSAGEAQGEFVINVVSK